MIFYEDLSLLHSIANKQTLFFAGMISRMDTDNVVQMTRYVRNQIITEIGSKTTNKLNLAKSYLHQIVDSGLAKDMGDGAYMVLPKIAGFTNFGGPINSKMDKWIRIEYKGKERKITVGNMTESQSDDE